jgi:hypothetical protein
MITMAHVRLASTIELRIVRRFMCGWAVGVLLFLSAAGMAADGPDFRLPNGPKILNGLKLEVDGRGVEAPGYRPVRITVESWQPVVGVRGYANTPLTADRQIRVVLGCRTSDYRRVVSVSQVIELPEGSKRVTATVLLPQAEPFGAISIDTYEGGEKLQDLSVRQYGWGTTNNWGGSWTEAQPAILFIDSQAPPREERQEIVRAYETNATDSGAASLPDVRRLVNVFPDNSQQFARGGTQRTRMSETTNITDAALLALLEARSRVKMIPPSELPERWIENSQYDVAVISLSDLSKLAADQPKQLAALRDWLSTGPMLMVFGCGQRFEELQRVESLLALPSLTEDEKGGAQYGGWTIPDVAARTGELQTDLESGDRAVPVPQRKEPQGPPPFVYRPAAMGCVVAIAAKQPFPGKPADWSWMFNAAGDQNWKRFKRAGFSSLRTNPDYWKLLIPGVGQAPVMSYLLLVSLFAVVIGPINYLLLDRARRLYLLLITVPAGALVVTASLFAFAAVSDGMRMRMRARSFTDLDQTTGRAAIWSRQSYYAAIAPSQGLRFPDDTTVFPLLHEPGERGSSKSTLMVWDGEQQLRGGYMTSRAATQFVATRATATQAGLSITEQTGGAPQVENRLGTSVKYLLLRNSAGEYFAASGVRDKSTVESRSIELVEAERAMQSLADAVRPALPEGYDDLRNHNNLFSVLSPRRYRRMLDVNAGELLMDNSLLETNIRECLRPAQYPLAKRSYVAIVENSPLMTTGVGRVREESSFHVVRGRY